MTHAQTEIPTAAADRIVPHNRTRRARSIPLKLLREGRLHFLPVYYLALLSDLAREGIMNSGSYRFADHIYRMEPSGRGPLGRWIDRRFLNLIPILTPRVLDVLWDDPTATAIFSVQLYESYKHFHVFNLYLERIGANPVTESEIIAVRRRNLGLKYDSATRVLTQYFMSEHFAAHAFFKDSRASTEPVLKRILHLVAQDEVRHSQFGYELLARRIACHPAERAAALDAARTFTHFGALVVDEVPIAAKNDFLAIVGINERLSRLCGEGIAA